MLDFEKINRDIACTDQSAEKEAKARWDKIAKPLNGLGEFERIISKIAALTGFANVELYKRAVVVFCADNGVVDEGVTQTDSCVTAIMAAQIRDRRSCVCRMAKAANADVFPIDMGMLTRVEGVEGCHIADGTKNIAKAPAMTKDEACRAIEYGIGLAKKYAQQGYTLLATGEMGIGNTTTSSAVASVLLNIPVEAVTGRGAGLSDEGLANKRLVISRAVSVNHPDPSDPLDVLSKLGGFDIAGMVGLFIGCALYRVPVIIDGLISSVCALIAARLCPNCKCAMIASHTSLEPASAKVLAELGLKAVLCAGMKLGEGTGAVCMMPLLDMALSVYNDSAVFADTGIRQYEKLGGEMA